MKLQDIAESIDVSKTVPIDFKGRKYLPISGDLAGEGVQARVYKTGIGTVTKVAVIDRDAGLHDSAVKFLELILKHQDNPFFPRIYHAKIYEDKTGERKHNILVVQMEKLVPLKSPKIRDSVVEMMRRLGIHEPPSRHDKETFIDSIDYNLAQFNVGVWRDDDKFKDILRRTTNPKFKEAFELMHDGFELFGTDLHSGNMMVRLTSSGPQLVVIDPFGATTFDDDI